MEITDAVIRLTSLAQESRLETFKLLAKAGAEGLAAGEIAQRLEVPAATMSFHLNHLRNAGLIESRRESRSIIYALRPETIRDLLGFITDECCQGQPELCRPAEKESECCEEA